jgi:hypothetical protein
METSPVNNTQIHTSGAAGREHIDWSGKKLMNVERPKSNIE